jgi:glycosyltransferase involved in cell wall biosynthesis
MLSACMIVQDEEECIDRALNSIHFYVDEIIVVDGGSKDRTRGIVTTYEKVQLFDIPFEDNFGLQRNNSLERASGDWIFVIDADEYCDPFSMASVKWLSEAKDLAFDSYWFSRQTFIDGRLVNLFDRDPTIRLFRSHCRYEGFLHEALTGFDNARETNLYIRHEKREEWQQQDNERFWRMGQEMPPGWHYDEEKDRFFFKESGE